MEVIVDILLKIVTRKKDMKKDEIKINITLGEISKARYVSAWDNFCDKYGYNYYCINEGADINNKVEITLEDAEKWGLIEN